MSRVTASARSVWIMFGGVVLLAGMVWAIGPVFPDSAFVSYRYAERLAGGHGLALNIGDAPGEGYPSLPWVAACAAMAAAGLDLPSAAPVAALVFALLCEVLLWRLLRHELGGFSLAAVLVAYAASGPLAVAAAAGTGATLNAFLLLALIAASASAAQHGGAKAMTACVASGTVLATCGLEWNLALPAALLFIARHRPGPPRRTARGIVAASALSALALAAWHAWRVQTFHHLVSPEWASRLLWSTDARFTSSVDGFAPWWTFYAALVLFALAGARARVSPRDRAALWLLAAASPLVLVFDDVPVLARLTPLIGPLLLPASRLLVRDVSMHTGRAVRFGGLAAVLLASIGCAVDARSTTSHVRKRHDVTAMPVAEWLARWRPRGVLATDIATLAYYVDWPTIAIGDAYPDVDAAAILKAGPEYVVLRSAGLFEAECSDAGARIAGAPQLALRYRLLAAIRMAWYEDLSMWIYVRRDLPEATDAELETLPMGLGSVRQLGR